MSTRITQVDSFTDEPFAGDGKVVISGQAVTTLECDLVV